jgi:lysophospholipase L1-like esterase
MQPAKDDFQRPPGDCEAGYDQSQGDKESRSCKAEATRAAERMRLLRLARHVGALGAVVAVFLVALEVVARLADPFGVSYYPETARYLDTLIIEEPIGYRNRPGLNGRFWETEVSINALGLRDRELEAAPAEHEFRILMLGDSVVFGLGLPEEDTIPRQLEGQLNLAADSPVYSVINMGVPSYNTEQELEQLRSIGLGLDPSLVLLIFSSNDLQPKLWVLNRRDSIIVELVQRSYALSLLAFFYWEVKVALTGYDNRAPYRHRLDAHLGWSTVQESLSLIASLCKAQQIPFVLVLQQSYDVLEVFAEKIGVPWIILEELSAHLRISTINSHPNKEGVEQMTLLIKEGLKTLGFIKSNDQGS